MQYSNDGNRQNIARQSNLITIGDLRRTPCLDRMILALDRGMDIGVGGLEAFVRIAHHFISEDKLVEVLQRQPGMDVLSARSYLERVVQEHPDPPTCAEVLVWQATEAKLQFCPFCRDGGCGQYLQTVLPYPNVSHDPITALTRSRYIVSVNATGGGAICNEPI